MLLLSGLVVCLFIQETYLLMQTVCQRGNYVILLILLLITFGLLLDIIVLYIVQGLVT